MLVRPAREHDTDTIAEIFVRSFAGLTFLPRLHTEDETRRWVRTSMVPSHEVRVAETDRAVVGFAALRDDLLGHLYVHPDAQNRGAGTALLEQAKLERPGGFRLWTFQRNEAPGASTSATGCGSSRRRTAVATRSASPTCSTTGVRETTRSRSRSSGGARAQEAPGTGSSRACLPRIERAMTSRWISLVPS